MVAVTFGGRVGAAASSSKTEPAVALPRKGLLVRIYDAMVQARLQQAAREIRMHAHLMPYTFDERGNPLVQPTSSGLPFVGR